VLAEQSGVEPPRIPIHVVPKPAIACRDCITIALVTADSRCEVHPVPSIWQSVTRRKNR
jgi:hypothetical protein